MADFKKTTLPIFYAKICIGFKDSKSDFYHNIEEVENICLQYYSNTKIHIAVTPTTFMHNDQKESGCFVEIINYLDDCVTKEELIERSIALAEIFLVKFHQYKIAIICPDEMIVIQ